MCVYVYLSNQVITIVFAIKDNQSYRVRLYRYYWQFRCYNHMYENIVYLDVDNVPTILWLSLHQIDGRQLYSFTFSLFDGFHIINSFLRPLTNLWKFDTCFSCGNNNSTQNLYGIACLRKKCYHSDFRQTYSNHQSWNI